MTAFFSLGNIRVVKNHSQNILRYFLHLACHEIYNNKNFRLEICDCNKEILVLVSKVKIGLMSIQL